MQTNLMLRKLENIDDLSSMHTKRINQSYKEICSRVDTVLQEEVKQLTEMAYKEGVLDGILFCRQIVGDIY